MSLVVENLVRRFGSYEAVSDFSLDVTDGEFVTLLGPSGCGKTTTLMTLAGFGKPDAGTIKLDGRVLSSAEWVVPAEQRSMAMVFQSYANWPHMSVRDNVIYGLKLRRMPRDEIERRFARMVELVELTGMESRYPSELSGGQQQRVALARALIVEPRVLLLDEPLSNLDTRLRVRMRDELRRLQRSTGITFIYVTHDQGEALAMSDKVVVMEAGVVHQIGSARDVFLRPDTPFVARFIGGQNVVSGRVVGRGGDRLEVELPGGDVIACQPAGGLAEGDGVLLGVRPDRVALSAESKPGSFALERADMVYLGEKYEMTFMLGTEEFKVHVDERRSADGQLQPRMWASVDQDEWRVFAAGRTPGARSRNIQAVPLP